METKLPLRVGYTDLELITPPPLRELNKGAAPS